jgi:hypothetical protein
MPCLNEARTLAACIEGARAFLARSDVDGEILIADNVSTDGSQVLARSRGARVVDVPLRGYGAALAAGVRSARGRFVVMGDADDSYDFSRLDEYLAALRAGEQLVMGDRFAGGIAPGAMPALHRYLGNPVLSFLGRLFFDSPIRDFHCGLRGFERDAIVRLALSSTGMEYASEMVVKATVAGLRIGQVPTTLRKDGRDRAPHLRSWRDGWRHLRFLLLHAPQWLFLYPGLALVLIGDILVTALWVGPLEVAGLGLDVHTMLYAMAGVNVGLQLVLFAAASSVHARRTGLLAAPSPALGWVDGASLERSLLAALALGMVGLTLLVCSVIGWASGGFGAQDPAVLMRWAIPASGLLMAACQLAATAFMLEYLRLPTGPGLHLNTPSRPLAHPCPGPFDSTQNPPSAGSVDSTLRTPGPRP